MTLFKTDSANLNKAKTGSGKTDAAEQNFKARRRAELRLPSRRKHALMAAISFCVLAAIPFIMTQILGNAKDALSFGSVAIAPIEDIAPLAPLDDEALPVPDILAAEFGANQNPTQNSAQNNPPARDALGNLIGNSSAPPITAQPNAAAQPSLSGPPNSRQSTSKTILIDGRAIGPSSLPPAPFAGLTGSNQYGRAPIKGPNGQTALNSYNRPFKSPNSTGGTGSKPVSIIIGGLGINRSVTQQAIDILPPDITLSFAAHATGLQDWINRARQAGHEVMIEIPMDSAQFNPAEKGADKALLINNPAAENLRNMEWLLSRGQGYFGVINYNGDNFLTRADISAPILNKLADSGVGFITDGAFSTPSLSALSGSIGLPYKQGFGLIDPEPNAEIIAGQLSNLASAAASGAKPIGVGFAYPQTLEAVASWAADLGQQGLILAPASHTLIP